MDGRPFSASRFQELRQQDRDHQIEQVGAQLRAQMLWLNPVEIRAGQSQASAEQPAAGASK